METNYSGFGRRFGALIIDLFLLLIGAVLIGGIIIFISYVVGDDVILFKNYSEGINLLYNILFVVNVIIFAWVYFALFESSYIRATPGKMALGIVVCDENEKAITLSVASKRFLARVLSIITLFYGYFKMLKDGKNQTLHDAISGTYVVNKSADLKKFMYGTNSIIITLTVLCIFVILNIFTGSPTMIKKVTGRDDLRWDLTENKAYSISDQTKEMVKNLEKEVEIYCLRDEDSLKLLDNEYEMISIDGRKIWEVVNQYDKYPKISLEYFNVEKNPGLIEKINPEGLMDLSYAIFVVASGDKKEKLTLTDVANFVRESNNSYRQIAIQYKTENAITSAINTVTAEKTPKIYFTQGYGEYAPDQYHTILEDLIQKSNFDIEYFNFATAEKMPEDMDAMVMISPKDDISEYSEKLLRDYFSKGGSALFIFEPSTKENLEFPKLEDVLLDFNIILNNDQVFEEDPKNHYPQRPEWFFANIEQSDIIDYEEDELLVPSARSIDIEESKEELIVVHPLLKTSSSAISKSIGSNARDDISGPLNVALAAENDLFEETARIAVIGSYDLCVDGMPDKGRVLIVKLLSWMSDMPQGVYVPSKDTSTGQVSFTQKHIMIYGILTILLIPIILIGLGIIVWMRRRHL